VRACASAGKKDGSHREELLPAVVDQRFDNAAAAAAAAGLVLRLVAVFFIFVVARGLLGLALLGGTAVLVLLGRLFAGVVVVAVIFIFAFLLPLPLGGSLLVGRRSLGWRRTTLTCNLRD
jgi:hypothetical protein